MSNDKMPPRVKHDFERGVTLVPLTLNQAISEGFGGSSLAQLGLVEYLSKIEHESLLLAERERCRREVQEAMAHGRIVGLQEAIREIQRGNLPYNRECKLTRKLFFLQKTREPIPAPGSEGAGGGDNL